jgi:O-antigen ligase
MSTTAFHSYAPTWAAPSASAPVRRQRQWLLGLFAVCLVIPVADVPGWGISLSTPIFCFLALDLVSRRDAAGRRPYTKWIVLAALFWLGQFFSIAGNVLAGELSEVSPGDILHLVRFAYWMTVFVVITVLLSWLDRGPWLCRLLANALMALGALRLAEALGLGTWGYAKAVLYTPNGYGLIFSTFTPFLLWSVLAETGWRRVWFGFGLAIAVLAIAGNGSRSSWVAVTLGVLIVAFWFAASQPRALRRLMPVLLAGVALSLIALLSLPADMLRPVSDRFSTVERLDRDKSYAIRQVLLRKAADLFSANPLLGVGSGRFRATHAPMEIPRLLSFRNEADLNRRSAHNAYAAVLAESGLVGALPLAGLLYVLAWQGWRAARLRAPQESWAIAVYASFIAMSAHLCTVGGLTGTAPWFLYGVVAALIHSREAGHSREA